MFVFTDPGIDDALALAMMASSSRPRMIGACGVDGNVPSRLASANLAGLLRLFGAGGIPVFQSTVNDPVHEYPVHVHGKNGLGNIKIVKPRPPRGQAMPLVDFLKSRGNFQILSLGPLTALSDLLKKSPNIAAQISRCVIMGGGIVRGNVTHYAEFNIHSNPDAADDIFRSAIPKILVPLDVTEKVKLYPEDRKELQRSGRRAAGMLAGMLQFYFNFQKKENGFYGGYMHDPSAVVAMTNPELFEFRRAEVRVDTTGRRTRGRTTASFSRNGHANTWITTGVKAEAVRSVIMEKLLGHRSD